MKLILLLIISLNLYSSSAYIDTISYAKVKKLVKEEEQIALAYKKYIRTKALAPSIDDLIANDYLPKGFKKVNLFGKTIELVSEKSLIKEVLPSSVKLKPNIYDYYYSNSNRVHTKAPLSIKNNYVKILLDKKEKYILKHQSKITTDKTAAVNKYYLDSQGVLHWYDASKAYKFSIDKDLIVDSSLDKPGSITFNSFFTTLGIDVLYAGQTTFHIGSESVKEYVNLGGNAGYLEVGKKGRDLGETMLKFTRRAGGMIVNGDLYTWGNNDKKVVAIGNNNYSISSSNSSSNTNVALNKPAVQSSTYSSISGASRAVDGNTYGQWTSNNNNSLSSTKYQANPWWRVDLGKEYSITKIDIYNRVGCCPERLDGAKVYVGNVGSSNPSDYTEVGTLNSTTPQTLDNLYVSGRYVMVYIPGSWEILTLAEVEVYGSEKSVILGSGKPIVNTLVRAKAKTYDSRIDNKNYFSSPLRPKFVDFTSDVWHSTCGISTKGELYCGGRHVLESTGMVFDGYTKGSEQNIEYLYRSNFFDGVKYKISELIPLVSTYIALGKAADDTLPGYFLYFWGSNNSFGWGGSGLKSEVGVKTPIISGKDNDGEYLRFKDFTFTLSVGYRRLAGLTSTGDIYTWGLDNNISSRTSCFETINGISINLCKPLLVQSDIKFETILGGQQTFLATDTQGNYYRISQPRGSLPKVDNVNELIKNYTEYKSDDDSKIISADISSKLNSLGQLTIEDSYGKGIVWINGKNQLKGDYFTAENKNDEFFKAAISKIKWKKIRVIEDKNGMCGIDINNQMYCWGVMSFYSQGITGNTFMLPLFNSNLHDLDKDFLVAEAKSRYVTPVTTGDWLGTNGEYFMKYPTYIGGFNYEFIFK